MLSIQKKMSNAFFALLSLPATAMGFALSVQISALSWILSTKYGLDIHEIGIVWAAGPIAGILAQPIVGILSDKMWFMGGRRRPWPCRARPRSGRTRSVRGPRRRSRTRSRRS